MGNKSRTFEELKELVFEKGYILLSDYFVKNNRHIIIEDKDGYKYDVYAGSILTENKTPNFVGISNPFSLKNIERWILINKKTYRLHEENVYKGNDKKLEFICDDCEDTFFSSWNMIYRGNGCSVCAGKQVGNHHSLFDLNPSLCKEWSSLNKISPTDVTLFSSKKVLWKCSNCEHEWEARVADRSHGAGCPACAGKFARDNYNLKSEYPELLDEWNYDENGSPESYTPHSSKSVVWNCYKCGYIYRSPIIDRAKRNRGCPVCAGKIVTLENSLFSRFRYLMDEWDYEKNTDDPKNISPFSGKRAWWICRDCHNSWNSVISSRTSLNRGCPNCSSSKGEKKIKKFLLEENIENKYQYIIKECRTKRPLPFDFYLLNYNLCIEYHGEQHYEPVEFFGGEKKFKELKKRDKIKEDYCYNNGIYLLIIPYWEFDNIETIITDTLNEIERS